MNTHDMILKAPSQNGSKTKYTNQNNKKNTKCKHKKIWTVDLRKTHYKVFKDVVETSLKWKVLKEENPQQPNLIWTDFYVTEDEVNSLLPYQKINHFPSSFQLGNKAFLTKNISKMKKKYPDQYSFLPQSWQLPEQMQLLKYQKQKKKGSTWILKPANLCQGKGIIITNNIEHIQQKIRQSKKQYVIQRYIQNPYLVNGLKFDLRLYVLVKSLKPLQIYLYKDGLARFATNSYQKPTKSNLANNYMHLTNYAINKKNPDFCNEDETGHKRKLSSLLETLVKDGKDINLLMSKISKAIVYTIISTQPMLSHLYMASAPSKFAKGKNCFQVFGFDFLIDQILDPFLLQVNHTPSFRVGSQVDKDVKFNLLKNTFLQLYNDDTQSQIYREPFIWNVANSSEYLQIYPTSNEIDPYSQIIQHSQYLFDLWTGVNKKVNRTQNNSPERKMSFSEKKYPRYGLRLNTADSQTNSPSVFNQQLRKTMTTLEKSFMGDVGRITFSRMTPTKFQRPLSTCKKLSHQGKSSGEVQKKSACVIYNFMQRNIDIDDFQPISKQVLTTKHTKKVLLKSFNSKYYKSARPKRFQSHRQRADE